MTELRVAAIQMTSGVTVAANLVAAAERLSAAAEKEIELVVLPENFAAMSHRESDRCALAEVEGQGAVQEFLSDQAVRNNLWIVGGTVPMQSADPSRPYASTLIYNPAGEQVARYDKMHLFDVGIPGQEEQYRESAHTSPGDRPVIFETPWGRMLPAICYDLRFPELFRRVAKNSPQVITVPAAFTVATGRAHWSALLKARAIENLSYVIAAAQVGTHENGRQTWGHSMIVSPWGEILAEAADDDAIVTCSLDLDQQTKLRKKFPVLKHQRMRVDIDH